MAEGQLGAEIGSPAARDQGMRTRLVQLGVVQHDQAGVAREIGPHVVVTAGVAELVDDEVERPGVMDRCEIVRRPDRPPRRVDRGEAIRARSRLGSSETPHVVADEGRDLVAGRQRRQDHGAVAGDPGSDGGKRREPGEAHLSRVGRPAVRSGAHAPPAGSRRLTVSAVRRPHTRAANLAKLRPSA
jgi:hypothetical protein